MVSPTTVLVHEAWLQSSENTSHRDRWLCDETILRRIRLRLPIINLNRNAINLVLKTTAGVHRSTNILGLYHSEFKTICLYSMNKKPRDVQYFYHYVCTNPSFPRFPSDVEDTIARAVHLVKEGERSPQVILQQIQIMIKEKNKLLKKKRKHNWKNKGKRKKGRKETMVQLCLLIQIMHQHPKYAPK